MLLILVMIVFKFTPNGKFISQFGISDYDPGQLNRPYGITIDTACRYWSSVC